MYKRRIPLVGQSKTNIVQAALLTVLHNWLICRVLPDAPLWLHIDLFVRIFVVGWYMETRDNGSLMMP